MGASQMSFLFAWLAIQNRLWISIGLLFMDGPISQFASFANAS
jgi:hypothetical protein